MDIEQLKLILETLQGLSHEAGYLAALYLWLHFAGSVLTSIANVSIFVGLFYFIYRAVRMSYGYDEADVFLREMRDQMGTGIHSRLTDDERQRTMTALRKLVAEAKNKEKKA
jgi:uncharacterized protein involved in tellurium resistance